jgi:Xaa-Pro aminopeptidase
VTDAERINTPVSTAELERRWTAVRRAMADAGIDVLLMQNNNDLMGGYVRYFTDVPAMHGYPLTVVFPRDAGMTVVGHGPLGFDQALPPEGDGLYRGVDRILRMPFFVSAHYSLRDQAALVETAMAPYAGAKVGLVGPGTLAFSVMDHLKRGRFSNTQFVDASDLVDAIKAIKSAEEIALIRRTAAMQDAAMEAAFAAVAPGKRDSDIASIAEATSHGLGSEAGIYYCASGPVGTAAVKSGAHTQNRLIRDGDQFTLMIENSGPGGMYCEVGRTCVLGRASDEMKEEFAFVLEAEEFTVGLLKPGAACRDIWEAYNQFMREHGRPVEQRVHCHGQGYDLVERPLVRFDDPMIIAAGMNITVHPTYSTARTYSWINNNYLIHPGRPPERLHQLPRTIVELG